MKSDNFNAALNHAHVVYKLILNLEDYTRNTSTDLFLTKLWSAIKPGFGNGVTLLIDFTVTRLRSEYVPIIRNVTLCVDCEFV